MNKNITVELGKDGNLPSKDFEKLKKTIKKTAKACLESFEEMETALADLSPTGAVQSDLPPSLGPYIDQKLASVYHGLSDHMDRIHDRINNLQQSLYNHTDKGHLPPIEGAGRMQKALKAIGLDDDYEVNKKQIYANDGTPTGFSFTFIKK